MHIAEIPASVINRRRLLISSAAVVAAGIATLRPIIVFARGAKADSPSFRITAADVNGARPYVISRPGYYSLAEDIAWTTRDPNARGIDIRSDYVTLDLNGHTFQQINPPAPQRDPSRTKYKGDIVSGNVGIWSDGQKGLVIRNGSVRDVQGVGILLRDCDHLDCTGLAVRGCGGNGTLDTSFLYRNGGLFVIGTKSASGTRFVKDVRIIDCTCEENTSSLDYVVTLGAFVLFTDDLEVKNGRFHQNANASAQPSGVQFNVVGIDIVICRNVLVEDCEANDNTSGGEPAGFFAWGENIKFLRSRANRNFTQRGNRACGFNVSTSNNIQMIDCEADGNFNANPEASSDAVKDFSACGFRIGRGIFRGSLVNCRATGNHSVGKNAAASGFALHSTSDLVLKSCEAIGNRNASGPGGGVAAGFHASVPLKDAKGAAVGGRNMTFIDCIADGNTVDREPLFVTAPAPPVDAGESRGDPRNGAGFFLEAQSRLTMIGCKALNNHGKGIWLRGCANANVQSATVSGNTIIGIENDAPAASSAFSGNTARLNGARHADNYVGLPTGTPVREWTLGAAPPTATDSFINTSISGSS
jgi:parallel beta-helix repeat protein